MDKIKVLHIVPKLDIGGIESALFNIFQEIDHSAVQWDFVVHGPEVGQIEKKLIEQGCKVYHVTPKKDSFFSYRKDLKNAYKSDSYDIIHAHQSHKSFMPLYIAKGSSKASVRIAHSHTCMSNIENTSTKKKVLDALNRKSATHLVYCAKEAGIWAFGKEMNGTWIPNGVDVNEFKYNSVSNTNLRNELNIAEDTIVLGMVCRIAPEKNISYALDVLSKLIAKESKNYQLVIVGDGPIRSEIEDEIKKRNLEDHVIMSGKIDGTAKYYSLFDIFLLPSFYEGFPVSLVEAQCADCSSFISNTISSDAIRSEHVKKLSIENSNLDDWVSEIERFEKHERTYDERMDEFDTKAVADRYLSYYKNILK